MHAGTMGRLLAAGEGRGAHPDMKTNASGEGVEQRLHRQFVAALAGDGASYRAFLAEASRYLRGYFRRRLGDRGDEAEDLVQETLLALHQHRHTYRPELPLTAWMHGIARYKLLDFLRARSREAPSEPLEDDDAVLAVADDEERDVRCELEQMLRILPPRQREALVMVKLAGASVQETARATGLSEASVKVGVHRGLRALVARFRSGA